MKATGLLTSLTAPARQMLTLAMIGLLVASNAVAQEAPKIVWVSYNDDQEDKAADDAVANGFTDASDHVYTQLLRTAGADLTRHLTGDVEPDTDVLNAADLVIISRAVVSGQYDDEATAWNTTVTTPILILTGYILRDNRMGLTTGNTMVDTVDLVKLKAEDPSHPVFAGVELDDQNLMLNDYAGIVTHNGIVQRGLSINNNPIIDAGKLIATIGTESDPTFGGMVIGEWEAGTSVEHDAGAEQNVLASRRMAFLTGSREINAPVSTAGIFDLESDGEQLFFNAVNYMAGSNLIPPPRVTSVSPRNNTTFADASAGFSFKAVSAEAIPADGIKVVINDRDVTSLVTIGDDPLAREVSYNAIQANRAYNIEITITAPTGTRTVNIGFDTFNPDDLVYIEAENFNFGGGNYFDDLVLCNDFGGTVTGCYFDRVSEQGVDAMDVNGTTDDRDFNFDAIPPEIFRFGSASREERVDTFLSTDVTRDAYANADEGSNGTIEDYDLELIAPGDWWNYTRTLDEGSYSAILRVSSASDATFELGLVTSSASQANQTVETIGQFSVTGRPGYQSITITDADGALAAFDANGESTLRLTAVDGEDAVINYLLLAPFVAEETPAAPGVLEGITQNADGTVTITWSGGTGLESSGSLSTPDWQSVAGATSPYTVTPEGAAFFRVAQ